MTNLSIFKSFKIGNDLMKSIIGGVEPIAQCEATCKNGSAISTPNDCKVCGAKDYNSDTGGDGYVTCDGTRTDCPSD